MVVISIISLSIIAPLITGFEVGFSLNVWADTLKAIPVIWIAVIALALITHKPAEWMTTRIIKEVDSFGSHMMINTLCTVFLMSIFMTVIGSWIGMRHISMEPIQMFFYKWPRNAFISFTIEAFMAQPIARFVMLKLHQNADSIVEQA